MDIVPELVAEEFVKLKFPSEIVSVPELLREVETPVIVNAPVTLIVPWFVKVPVDMLTSPAESVTVPPEILVNKEAGVPSMEIPVVASLIVKVAPLLFIKVEPDVFASSVSRLNEIVL